jgi:hypothetical protein
LAVGFGLAAGAAGAAFSAEPAHPALSGLNKCAEVADSGPRAACYDAALSALSLAVQSGEVVIVQRKEAQAAQRSVFGLNLPGLNIFDMRGKDSAPLVNVIGEAKRAYPDPFGKWIVVLTDGAVWRQIDSEPILRAPRAGSQIEIQKAAFGSYFLKVDGQRSVRAKRSE